MYNLTFILICSRTKRKGTLHKEFVRSLIVNKQIPEPTKSTPYYHNGTNVMGPVTKPESTVLHGYVSLDNKFFYCSDCHNDRYVSSH